MANAVIRPKTTISWPTTLEILHRGYFRPSRGHSGSGSEGVPGRLAWGTGAREMIFGSGSVLSAPALRIHLRSNGETLRPGRLPLCPVAVTDRGRARANYETWTLQFYGCNGRNGCGHDDSEGFANYSTPFVQVTTRLRGRIRGLSGAEWAVRFHLRDRSDEGRTRLRDYITCSSTTNSPILDRRVTMTTPRSPLANQYAASVVSRGARPVDVPASIHSGRAVGTLRPRADTWAAFSRGPGGAVSRLTFIVSPGLFGFSPEPVFVLPCAYWYQ